MVSLVYIALLEVSRVTFQNRVTEDSNWYLSANVLKRDQCTAGIDLPPVGPVRHRDCALRAVLCRL